MSKIGFAAIVAAAFVLPTAVSAKVDEATSEITAVGEANHAGWLKAFGPDEHGRYTARIDISDLDVTTSSGRAALSSRVKLGTSMLCDRIADAGESREYYTSIHLACWHNTWSQARPQMDNARTAAVAGKRFSMLELGSPPAH
ncbi:MAG: hypothetical protein AB7F98_06815 [Novosphingobium sp.]